MEFERPPNLRTVNPAGGTTGGSGTPIGGGQSSVNAVAELVADLLGTTGLIPPDKLAIVRGRAGAGGSLAQALVDEGVASG